MSNTHYRILPTTIGPYTSWNLQRKERWWQSWATVAFADSKAKAELMLTHLSQEPLYYVGTGKRV